jgi:cobalamin biosynthesis protein CobT
MYADTVAGVADNTFVCVLVDCSGSMLDSTITVRCPEHGVVNQKGDNCSRRGCGKQLNRRVHTPAGHAAVAATAVHDTLRACAVPHTVLGYSTVYNPGWSGTRGVWSQDSSSNCMFEFVAAPGLRDTGGGLAYINGHRSNLDGEALIAACKYSASHAADAKRIVVIVIADGLPAGADGHNDAKHLSDMIERVAHAGIEIYGIGVGLGETARKAFSSFYANRSATPERAATGHVTIDAQGLNGATMRALSRLLLGGSGSARRG